MLVLALVVGPGLVPAGAAGLVQDGLAGPGKRVTAGDGAEDLPGDPLAEGAVLGTVTYESKATEPRAIEIQTAPRIYLPWILQHWP